MSGEYTPTVDEVRGVYVASGFRENLPHSHQSLDEWRAEFDRWLARVRAEAQVKALREAADAVRFPNEWVLFRRVEDDSPVGVGDYLREAADGIARESLGEEAGISVNDEQEDEG